jgi:xylulokinase
MMYIAQNPGAPLGDALLAGIGSEVIEGPQIINEWLEITETTKPNPPNRKLYDNYYTLFRKIYENNRKIYEDLAKITQ